MFETHAACPRCFRDFELPRTPRHACNSAYIGCTLCNGDGTVPKDLAAAYRLIQSCHPNRAHLTKVEVSQIRRGLGYSRA